MPDFPSLGSTKWCECLWSSHPWSKGLWYIIWLKGTTSYDGVAEDAINFIRNGKSRGDIVDLPNRTFASLDSLSEK